jgi:quercetin dioxygenase-like cupin family protein
MKSFLALALAVLVAYNIAIVRAGDADPLQDFCVADKTSKVNVNGFPCKDASMVTAEDFMFKGLNIAGDTSKMLGSNVTQANVMQIPGLNTLGISMVRIDYAAPLGLNPPHTHPRATEILVVIEGTLSVGFITTDNRLFSKTLEKGDVFVFPKGLVHFQLNVGRYNAVAIAALSSQLPGTQQVAMSLFGASPPVDASLLAKAFKIDASLVQRLQREFLG